MRKAFRITDPNPYRKSSLDIIEKRINYVKSKLLIGWSFRRIAMEIGVQKAQLYRYCYYRKIYENGKRNYWGK